MLSAARVTVWSIRRRLVSGLFAIAIHSRISRLEDGGKLSKLVRAASLPSSCSCGSSGIAQRCSSGRSCQVPAAFGLFDSGLAVLGHESEFDHLGRALPVQLTPPA